MTKIYHHEILVIDDEIDICKLITGILEDEGYRVRYATNSQQAMEEIERRIPSLIILDVWLKESRLDGMELLDILHHAMPRLPIVMISGHATVDMALQATRNGASDFLTKPFKSNILIYMVSKALKIQWLQNNQEQLIHRLPEEKMTGKSSIIQSINRNLPHLANNNSRILISGEIGTGKTTTALQIHRHSNRIKSIFLQLDCGLVKAEQMEKMLYGVSSNANRPPSVGMLEQAHGGTLVLENVDDIDISLQSALSRILHKNRLQRIGGTAQVDFDTRIIATTRKDLKKEIQAGFFLPDLYHRLNVVSLHLPSLRDRQDDIVPLAEKILESIADRNQWAVATLSQEAMDFLQNYEWRGNIWELSNLLERILILGTDHKSIEIDLEIIHLAMVDNLNLNEGIEMAMTQRLAHLSLREARDAFEKLYIDYQLQLHQGNISRTANRIGINRSALHRKIRSLGLKTKNIIVDWNESEKIS